MTIHQTEPLAGQLFALAQTEATEQDSNINRYPYGTPWRMTYTAWMNGGVLRDTYKREGTIATITPEGELTWILRVSKDALKNAVDPTYFLGLSQAISMRQPAQWGKKAAKRVKVGRHIAKFVYAFDALESYSETGLSSEAAQELAPIKTLLGECKKIGLPDVRWHASSRNLGDAIARTQTKYDQADASARRGKLEYEEAKGFRLRSYSIFFEGRKKPIATLTSLGGLKKEEFDHLVKMIVKTTAALLRECDEVEFPGVFVEGLTDLNKVSSELEAKLSTLAIPSEQDIAERPYLAHAKVMQKHMRVIGASLQFYFKKANEVQSGAEPSRDTPPASPLRSARRPYVPATGAALPWLLKQGPRAR